MIACWPAPTATRTFLAIVPALLGLSLLSGCEGEGYPADLVYPARTDPLVIGKPDRDAPRLDKPGEFPNVLFAELETTEREKLLFEPAKVTADQRGQIDKVLVAVFGTPAQPKVEGGSSEVRQALADLSQSLQLDQDTLKRGSELYRHQCLHCHGLTGDGRGPTAPWVNPHPRDYRQGSFKFTSSKQSEGVRKPRKGDLVRTIREGIEGSSMPSFRLLPDEEQEALASYVIHLSLRGEVEYAVIKAIFNINDELEKGLPNPIESKAEEWLVALAGRWQEAQKSLIQPDPVPPLKGDEEHRDSVQRGWKLFIQAGGAGCIGCHTDYGRQSTYKFDEWGTIVRPTDLTTGTYRGGRRPIDLFWRIHSGIKGTGMTAFGQTLSSKDIWDLVDFLQVAPYPQMRQKYGIQLENQPETSNLAARPIGE